MRAPTASGVLYVYGIARSQDIADLAVSGVGNPPQRLRAVRHRDLAALVSQAPPQGAAATRDDVLAHARALEAVVAHVTVLPMRFGMTLTDEQTVIDELLARDYERWDALLEALDGTVELRLRAFHDQEVLLQRVAEEHSEVRDLQHSASLEDRLRLGQVVAGALERHRGADAGLLLDRLRPLASDVVEEDTAVEGMVVNAAFLIRRDALSAFDAEVAALAEETSERMRLRCLGPQPPYTFVNGGA